MIVRKSTSKCVTFEKKEKPSLLLLLNHLKRAKAKGGRIKEGEGRGMKEGEGRRKRGFLLFEMQKVTSTMI